MKQKEINLYKDIVLRVAEQSYANRKKVGSIIVKDNSIISMGYNGTPKGQDNSCEYYDGIAVVTKPEVIHSEINSIAKLAASTNSSRDSSMFSTCSCCMDCAKVIVAAEIKEFFYIEQYRDVSGLDFLKKCGVKVQQI